MSQDKTSITVQAQRYAAKGQIDKAIKEWEKVVDLNPTDGNVHNTIGDLLLRKNETQNAIEFFFKAAGFFKDEGFALKAMALYKKVLNLDTENIQALVLLAEINADRGLVGNANENYLSAADLYVKNGSVEKAVELYEKIMFLSPSNFLLYIRIADLYAKIGLVSDARKVYLQSAHGFFEKGDLDRAERLFSKAMEVDPFDPSGFIGLSKILSSRGQVQEAMSVLDRAMARIPDNPKILFAKAKVAFEAGRTEEALAATQAVLQIERYNLPAQRLLGEIYLAINRPDEAWNYFRTTVEAMVSEERYSEALELLELMNGIQEYRSEVMRRQATIYRQLGELDRSVEILKSLGSGLLADGETEDALKIFTEAQSLAPEDQEIDVRIRELQGEGEEEPEGQAEEVVEDDFTQQQPDTATGDGYDMQTFQEIDPVITGSDMLSEEFAASDDKDPDIGFDTPQSSSPDLEEFVQMMDSASEAEEVTIGGWDDSQLTTYDQKFEEDLAEADFYLQQGLKDEAIKLYERLASLFPQRAEPVERLANLIPIQEQSMDVVVPEPNGHKIDADSFFKDLNTTTSDNLKPKSTATDEELTNIFDAFKKGVKDEVEESDFETHYDLGIAYKEMGLLDDAIREFNVALKGRVDSFQSSSMLAMCYVEKGLHEQAISEYRKLISMLDEADDRYLSVKYDLASAVEQFGDVHSALAMFIDIYNADPYYNDVAARINNLKNN